MTEKKLRFRVRFNSNAFTFSNYTSKTEILYLLNDLEFKTQLPFNQQQLLSGFPPKPLDINSSSQTLGDLNINSGDQLILKKSGTGGIKKGKSKGPYIPPSDPKGYFVQRKMPGDNSCLFHSLAYVLEDKSRLKGPELRKLCANKILENPKKYNNTYLGQSNVAYYHFISNKDAWGGSIEIRMLCDHYQIEVCAFDLHSARIDKYGIDKGYTRRVLIFYNGKHYDALALAKHGGANEKDDQVIFGSQDKSIMKKATAFIKELNGKLFQKKSKFQI